ncbi:hypothetical protein AEYBE204_19545 [Asticcacaulis sp. YBE204]|nr:hypothetical protein AEYBE204_19545 [Asticcacaulis sp. YBE204]
MEVSPGHKFGAAVKSDGLSTLRRKASQGLLNSTQHTYRVTILVADDDVVATLSLQQTGNIGLAVFTTEDHEIGLPVAESLAISDIFRSLIYVAIQGDMGATRLSAMQSTPRASSFGKKHI